MYFIGPLLFWAWAEMTAGFFILSVPCLPKLIAESKLPTRIKAALGVSRESKSRETPSGLVTIGGTGGSKQLSKNGLPQEDRYYQIQDDGMAMSDLGHSESQEHLHQGKGGMTVDTRPTAAPSYSPAGSDVEVGYPGANNGRRRV